MQTVGLNWQHSGEIAAALTVVGGGLALSHQRTLRTVGAFMRETAVIGGLTETTVTKNRNSIPILGELPLIGNLFSQTNSQDEKQDLLILITPHVLHETDAVRK